MVVDRCGSLWIVVGSLWIVVDRCGSLWIVVGRCRSLWVVPGFSNYVFDFRGQQEIRLSHSEKRL